MALTILDIAKLSNSSKSTVSRYLNGGSVSPKTAERIKKVIDETGFELNLSAKRLKAKKSHLIGVLVEGIWSVSVGKVLRGINKSLREQDYQPFIMIDEVNEDNKISSMKSLIAQGVDGIILGVGQLTPEHLAFLHSTRIPTIILGQECESLPFKKVDDFSAGKLLAEYVIELNKRSIAYVGISEQDKAIGVSRKQGFIETIKKNCDADVYFIETDFSMDNAYSKAKEILDLNVDMIVGATDRICIGIMRYLNEHNIKIPDQVSIAGFGNYDFSNALYPSLTSVDFDYYLLGTSIANDIIKLVDKKNIISKQMDYPFHIVKRKSTGFISSK